MIKKLKTQGKSAMMRLVKDTREALDIMPQVLYKYRTWEDERHKDLLRKGEVFFASPDSFEDPYDCNLPTVFPEGIELFKYFYTVSLVLNNSFSEEEHFQFASYWAERTPIANPREREDIVSIFKKVFDSTHGVLSLCMSKNNEAMWEKYGGNHKGYCVGLDIPILCQTQFLSGGGVVDYIKGIPKIDYILDTNDEQIQKQLFSKSDVWSFEEEYRLLKMNRGKALSMRDRTMVLPRESVVEVYLGKNIEIESEQEIREIVSNRYPNAMVVKCL